MEKIIKLVIIFFASLIATVLFIIGIKKLKIKKRGLFTLTLLLSLTIMGCKTSNKENNNIGVIKMNKLENTKEWQTFKESWEKINEFNKDMIDFPDTITAGSLEDKITTELDALRKSNPDKISEFDLLLSLCKARLHLKENNMSRMIVHAPVTATMNFSLTVINNLEDKIRELQKLKQEETKDNYQSELKKIIVKIKDFLLINSIDKNYFSFRPAPFEYYDKSIFLSDIVIQKLEDDYNNRKKNNSITEEWKAKYNKSKSEIQKIETVFDNLSILLTSLILD